MNLALGFDFFPAEEVGSDELLKGLQREAAEITEVFDDGDSPALIEAARGTPAGGGGFPVGGVMDHQFTTVVVIAFGAQDGFDCALRFAFILGNLHAWTRGRIEAEELPAGSQLFLGIAAHSHRGIQAQGGNSRRLIQFLAHAAQFLHRPVRLPEKHQVRAQGGDGQTIGFEQNIVRL